MYNRQSNFENIVLRLFVPICIFVDSWITEYFKWITINKSDFVFNPFSLYFQGYLCVWPSGTKQNQGHDQAHGKGLPEALRFRLRNSRILWAERFLQVSNFITFLLINGICTLFGCNNTKGVATLIKLAFKPR